MGALRADNLRLRLTFVRPSDQHLPPCIRCYARGRAQAAGLRASQAESVQSLRVSALSAAGKRSSPAALMQSSGRVGARGVRHKGRVALALLRGFARKQTSVWRTRRCGVLRSASCNPESTVKSIPPHRSCLRLPRPCAISSSGDQSSCDQRCLALTPLFLRGYLAAPCNRVHLLGLTTY